MYIVYKHIGETPLQCIQRLFDTARNSYTYAGRLDPMAEGLLLILENEECERAREYYHLAKTYEYSFIVGVSTDSYDCLGRITAVKYPDNPLDEKVERSVGSLTGSHTLPYPPYSSKTVDGIPLFAYARQNKLHTITIPTNTVQITEHMLTDVHATTIRALVKDTAKHIQKVQGDFRQEEVLRDWRALSDQVLRQYSAFITTSGGTYVRAVVNAIGSQIGYPTVTTHIKRTKIGEWEQPGVYALPSD